MEVAVVVVREMLENVVVVRDVMVLVVLTVVEVRTVLSRMVKLGHPVLVVTVVKMESPVQTMGTRTVSVVSV